MTDVIVILGLVLLTSPYWVSSILKTAKFQAAVEEFTNDGLPFPSIFVIATILFQAIASVMLVIGYFPLLAAIGLVGFTVLASVVGHAFWSEHGPSRNAKLNGFIANVGLMGGVILAALIQIQN